MENTLHTPADSKFKCSCGVSLDAVIEHKRKYKRNRNAAKCPYCGKGYIFRNMPPKQSVGAYILTLKEVPSETSE